MLQLGRKELKTCVASRQGKYSQLVGQCNVSEMYAYIAHTCLTLCYVPHPYIECLISSGVCTVLCSCVALCYMPMLHHVILPVL